MDLSALALIASEKTNVQLQVVLEIEGISTVFGASPIRKYLQYGDDIEYGENYYYGGFIDIADQKPYISMTAGTTTRITQIVRQDKGDGESISSIQIALVDKNNELSKLFQPGNIIDDTLGRKAKVWLGFENTAFVEDFIVCFRGYIDQIEVGPGLWTINIIHSDNRRRADLFIPKETALTSGIDGSQTTIPVTATSEFLLPKLGPDGSYSSMYESLIQIDDEVIRYTGYNATNFTGCTRGYLGTANVAHSSNATVKSRHKLRGNSIDLSLALMLSNSSTELAATNFVRTSPVELIPNCVFFDQTPIAKRYNIRSGDYITTSGASSGSNNVTLKKILTVAETELGSYIVIDGVSFTEEVGTSATVQFRSAYDVLPDGLQLSNDEVDISRHEFVRDSFLSFVVMEFHLDDVISGKEFISTQLFNPVSAYSIPREARCSIGFHIGPLPNQDIKILDQTTVKKASEIKINRTTSKNFYNTITVKYDPDILDQDFYTRGFVNVSATSLTRIPIGNKSLKLEASGLRSADSAESILLSTTNRRLKKYKYGAEFFKVRVAFKTGFSLDIDDVLLVDLADLKIMDQYSGSRQGEPRLFEVQNKSIDIKTGDIELEILDTNQDANSRYCLMSPSSFIQVGVSTTEFIIEPSFNTSRFGVNEYKKWEKWIGASVRVHTVNFSTSSVSKIYSVTGNTIVVSPALSFVPAQGMIMELSHYNDQPDNIKTVYGFMNDNATFADSKKQYQMI